MVSLPFCHLAIQGEKPGNPAYPEELETIGDHIRKRRLDLGLRQRDVADTLGVDKTTVYNWEKQGMEPNLRDIPKIIEFLGYNPFPEPKSFGEEIIRHRKTKGQSQGEAAKEIGVDQTTLARWERDEKMPTGKFCEKIVRWMTANTSQGCEKILDR